eukprot:1894912-Pleurochrysis_carterae.AAC.1
MRNGPSLSELQLRSALRNCSTAESGRWTSCSSGMYGGSGRCRDVRTGTPLDIAKCSVAERIRSHAAGRR